MADLIGEALVQIKPDLRGLRFQVQTGVAQALRGLELGGLTAATTGLTTATGALSATQLGLAGSAIAASDAEGTLAVALGAAGIAAGTAAAENVALASANLGLAGSSAAIGTGLRGIGKGADEGSKGVKGFGDQSNIARGAIIGLARVTPVAIFGLGVVGTAAVAAAIGIRQAISLSADFEQQMNVFGVVSEATAEQMAIASETARELGRDLTLPGVSAGDAAASLTELSKAGIDFSDAIAAARGVLQLGTAAQIDFASAAQITASSLNAFSLEGSRAVDVADLLAAASIAAQGDITDMAASLNQAQAVAAQANISIEDTVTAISLLAKNGLLGSDAGTSLRTTILRLVPTTKEAAQFVRALGIEFEDAQGRLRPLPEIFDDYREALAKLPPVLQQAALQQIFGQDAIRAASILAREGSAGFEEMAKQVTREGVAAEVAGAQTEGFSGKVSRLESNLESLGVTIGSGLLPILGGLVDGLAIGASAVDSFLISVGDLIDKLENPIEIPTPEDLPELADQINRLREGKTLLQDIQNIGTSILSGGIIDITFPGPEEAGKLGEQLKIAGLNARELQAIFSGSSSLIGKSLEDGIIDPLETIELMQGRVGRAFLRSFAGAGSDLLTQVRAVTQLTQRLGREPVEQEIRFVVAADDFDQALRDVRVKAAQEGTLGAKFWTDAFANDIQTNQDVPRAGEQLIDGSREFTDAAAKSAGKSAGKNFSDGFVDAISDSEQRQINAARRAVEAAVEAAEDAVLESVFSARDNLDQLGSDLSSDLETLIDTSPIAQEIERLQDRLDAVSDRREIGSLREEQRKRREALREAREAIAQRGPLTPAQAASQKEFLAPFVAGVKDADAALKEFSLDEKITSLEDAQEAAKEAAEKGLANLIQRFKDGKVSADDFQKLLTRQLQPALDTLNTKAGKNLGLSFEAGFLENVSNLREQVSELVGFLGITGPSPDVVRPGDVQAEGRERVEDARRNLAETIANAKATAENTGASSDTLRRIERILKTDAARQPGSPGGTKITSAELASIRQVT